MTKVLTLDEIKPLIAIPQLIDAIAEGFVLYSKGRVNVPPVGFLHFDQPPGDVHIKYGAVNGDDYYVMKVASAFYTNPTLGLPSSNGVILVFSQKTGVLKLVLLDEGWLTDMRTAAAGAVVAKHLAPEDVRTIGIVGTGIQARLQLELLKGVIDAERCLIWGRSPEKAEQMIAELQQMPVFQDWNLKLQAVESLETLVPDCQLIITTTPAKEPLIKAEWLQKGTHITAMGSDDHGKQELEASVLAKADVVVADSIAQCIDHGECLPAVEGNYMSAERILELGDMIHSPALGRTNPEQITVADLTGVAIQDIQIAKLVDQALNLSEEV